MFYNLKLRSVSLSLLIISILVIGTLQLNATSAFAINTPWLHVSGNKLMDPSNNVVILRGVSLVDVGVANTSGRGRTAIQLTNMATDNANGWYARVVRFPVYPDAIDMTPGWKSNPDAYFNNHLNPAIQNCVARQIYCIIDWHYITDYNNSTVDTATRNFWNYIAPKYANTPNVIFELYNEPIGPNDWNTWKTWAQPWVNIIRAAAPNNLILIGSPQWSQTTNQAANSPFSGSNLMYVVHIYPQHGGQGTWDSWFGNTSGTVPYFLTEFGWQNGGGQPTSGTTSGFGVPFYNYLETKQVSWTAWVFDKIWQPVMFDANWNLLGGENFMGQMTKDELTQHQNDNLPGGGGGSTLTPTRTNTRTNTPAVSNTPTRTPTRTATGATATRTRTPTRTGSAPAITNTPTRTPTRTLTPAISNTPTRTPTRTNTSGTPVTGGCSPVTSIITAPFTWDGAGVYCWQIATIPGYVNNWNNNSVSINGTNYTNIYVAAGSLPAKINNNYYISFNGSFAWSHLEVR
jgi:endoglucanase